MSLDTLRDEAELRHIHSLQFITRQLNGPGYRISQRFSCLGSVGNFRQRQCNRSAEGFMMVRPRMVKRTWDALKKEKMPVSASDFTDIVRSMFCGYHDVASSYTEKQKKFLRELWQTANSEERKAFLEAIENGLRDVYGELHRLNNIKADDVEEALGRFPDQYDEGATSEADDTGTRELRMVVYTRTSLDSIREKLGLNAISPEETVEPKVYTSNLPRDADMNLFGASPSNSKQLYPPSPSNLERKITKSEDHSTYPIKTESPSPEPTVKIFGTTFRSSSSDSREAGPTSSNPPPNIDGDKYFKHALFDNQEWGRNIFEFNSLGGRDSSRSLSPRSKDRIKDERFRPIQGSFLFGPKTILPAVSAPTEACLNTANLPTHNIPQSDLVYRSYDQSRGMTRTPSRDPPASLSPSGFLSPSHHLPTSRSESPPSTPTPTPATTSPKTPRSNQKRPAAPLYIRQTLEENAANIREIIFRPIAEGNKGTMYILKAPKFFSTFAPAASRNETWLKIGISRDVPKRIASLRAQCGLFDLTEIREDDDEPFTKPMAMEHLRRIERLCHEHLNNLRRRMDCTEGSTACDVVHTEWFAVGEELAKQTVRLWVRFMAQRPYSQYGSLYGIWPERVGNPSYLRLKKREAGDVGVMAWEKWLEEGTEARPEGEDI